MLRFISFGSGSSGNCYYLYTETDAILIDVGIGLRYLKKGFQERGLRMESIRAVLVTHDHADHVKSVGSLSHDYALPVYATELVHQGIRRNYSVRYKILPELTRCIQKDETFTLGAFRITPFGVPHDSTDNVGYRIECEGVVFCLMTDVGHVAENMLQHIADANYLVIEANHDKEMVRNGTYPKYLKHRILGPLGHLSNNECGTVIAENMSEHLRHIWLCHLSEENNHPELARKTVESVLQSYGIIAGKDVQLDVLKRRMPSEVIELT